MAVARRTARQRPRPRTRPGPCPLTALPLTVFRPNAGLEILVPGSILEIKNDAPDEVRSKPAQQHHDESRQASQERVRARGLGGNVDWPSRRQRKRKAGAHNPEKVATNRPLVKLNSAITFFFSASGISFSLVSPAKAAMAIPIKQTRTRTKSPARLLWRRFGRSTGPRGCWAGTL